MSQIAINKNCRIMPAARSRRLAESGGQCDAHVRVVTLKLPLMPLQVIHGGRAAVWHLLFDPKDRKLHQPNCLRGLIPLQCSNHVIVGDPLALSLMEPADGLARDMQT
jgi:hypothetical protein